MRTTVFLSSWAIADAINKDWVSKNETVITFVSIILISFFIMDILEFFHNMSK